MKQEILTIQGHNTYPSITRVSYIPLSNLTDAMIPNSETTLIPPFQVYHGHMTEIEALKRNIEKVRDTLPTGLKGNDIHHTIGYAGVLIAVSIIIFLSIQCWLKARKNKRIVPPAPKPRNRTTSADIPRRQHPQAGTQEDRFSICINE